MQFYLSQVYFSPEMKSYSKPTSSKIWSPIYHILESWGIEKRTPEPA